MPLSEQTIALILEKFGLQGAVILVLFWAMWRFGPTPTKGSSDDAVTVAIGKLSDKVDTSSEKMAAKVDNLRDRVATIEGILEGRSAHGKDKG